MSFYFPSTLRYRGAGIPVPPAPESVAGLAKRYASKELGEVTIHSENSVTKFDMGEWPSTVASL